jgi:hypothetical protein
VAERLLRSASETVLDFRQIAKQYVELIENCHSMSRNDFVKQAHRFLADLYRMGALLSGITSDGNYLPRESVTHDQWAIVYQQIRDKLGDVNVYWGVWDPADPEDRQAIQCELSSDLADICQDLKNVLPIDDSMQLTADDLWLLQQQFAHHWGQHAISALSVIHSLLNGPSYLVDCEPV